MSKTANDVKLAINSNYGKRQLRIPCIVKDGSDAVFDLMDGGAVNVQTTHGHYVAIDNQNLKALIIFLMGHIFPDTNVSARS